MGLATALLPHISVLYYIWISLKEFWALLNAIIIINYFGYCTVLLRRFRLTDLTQYREALDSIVNCEMTERPLLLAAIESFAS